MNDSLNTVPLFSVITITKNNHLGLEKTYHSLAAQTFQNYEWVVVDGASQDGTLEFLKSGTNLILKKTIVSAEDGGIYDAMNKGIRITKGDYLVFLNAGDELAADDVLQTISSYTEKAPDFIYGDALEGKPPILKPARRYKDLPWVMITHHQAMLYRRAIIREFKMRYSILYEIAGDYDFTARFLQKARSMIYIPKPICIFEQGGVSQQKALTGRKEQFEIREQLELVSQPMNVWIFLMQSAAWRLKRLSPRLYRLIKRGVLGAMKAFAARKDRNKA